MKSQNDTTINNQFKNILEKHKQGRLAVHTTYPLPRVYDKLDAPGILNNLREDGGSQFRINGYQLYTIISTTILPPEKYPIRQRLYEPFASTFLIFDITKSKIKSYYIGDSESTYHHKNKHGRPSYRARLFLHDLATLSNQKRLSYLDYYNRGTAKRAIENKSKFRDVNETLLKINIESLMGLGITASNILEYPGILFDLIYFQKQFYEYLGVIYPIVVFNNTSDNLNLNFIDSFPVEIKANQFHLINVEKALKYLKISFPEGIKMSLLCSDIFTSKNKKTDNGETLLLQDDFLKILGYELDKNDFPRIPDDAELNKLRFNKQSKLLNSITSYYQKLSSLLPDFNKNEKENIIITHKKNHANAKEIDKYKEINQTALTNFIKKEFNLSDLNSDEQKNDGIKNLKYISNAYNLQFRLSFYIEILSAKNNPINFKKIEEDIEWCDYLISKINAFLIKKDEPKNTSIGLIR